MRYFIELSYRGTDFCGWQIQENGPSVQAVLNDALTKVLRQPIETTGSSRTDAGVHSSQQFAHFDVATPIQNPASLLLSLNGILPFSMAVHRLFEVAATAHARFDATHRCYEYRITTRKNPFLEHTAYFFRGDVCIEKMNSAAQILIQHHDFQCFSKVKTTVKTFNCQIEYAYWTQNSHELVFHIKADRFLRGMVRAIVGTLIEVGLGKLNAADFEAIIQSKNRNQAKASVPAEGLFLVEVGYPSLG